MFPSPQTAAVFPPWSIVVIVIAVILLLISIGIIGVIVGMAISHKKSSLDVGEPHHLYDYVQGELQLGNVETNKNVAYGPIAIRNLQQSHPDAEYEELPGEAQPDIELQENTACRSVQ